MNVLIADKFEQAGIDGIKALGCAVAYEPGAGADGLAAAIAAHKPDILIVRSTKVAAPVIQGAAGLRAIIRAGAGVDNIDLPAASAAGIAVANCPGMNAVAVAELSMAHLLSCDRRLVDQTVEARAGTWNKKEFAKARGLKGLTLLVVGAGAIGAAMIRRALAFEMDVVAWSRSLTPASARALGARFGGSDRAALLKLTASADAVSVHVAATHETKHLCNAEFFAALKPGAYFVNTSRGSVVDEAALRGAVQAKGVRAGLDVFENQPAAAQGPWESVTARLPGVTVTHHAGASTDQAQSAVADETARLVKVFLDTGRLENCVNERELSAGRVQVKGARPRSPQVH